MLMMATQCWELILKNISYKFKNGHLKSIVSDDTKTSGQVKKRKVKQFVANFIVSFLFL